MKIFRRAAPILGLLSFGLLAAPLAAAPRSINDCEKIQAADAYNQCLASFGPVAHLHGMSSGGGEAGGDEGGGDTGGDAPAPAAHHRHWGHRSNGRVYMELDAGAGSAPVAAHTHRHWTHWHGHRGHHRH